MRALLLALAAAALLPLAAHATDELVILIPGLGDNPRTRPCMEGMRAVAAKAGYTLVVADFRRRESLATTTAALRNFIRAQKPEQYKRVHIVAWILGGWSLNEIMQTEPIPNLATLIYDRSPTQERVPYIVDRRIEPVVWALFGPMLSDLSLAPYRPWTPTPDTQVGLLIENRASKQVLKFEQLARAMGPLHYEAAAFEQAHHDLMYTQLDHKRLYLRFDVLWPDLLHFFKHGRFSAAAARKPLEGDPWQEPPLSDQCVLPL